MRRCCLVSLVSNRTSFFAVIVFTRMYYT
jgi:hypothetical protein